MVRARRVYVRRLEYFVAHERAVIAIQSYVRMWLARRKYVRRRAYLSENERAAVKIQAFVRACRARLDYNSLVKDKNPALRVVRKFVHLLEHNSAALSDELALHEHKRHIITLIKQNKLLEQELDMMDVKIGLLVKNRLTVQDVLMQHKKMKKYNEDIELSQAQHVRQLSKESHDKIELYQNLFYLMQTRPVYLAKLLCALPTTNSSRFVETVVLQLFNYGANGREEYLLLKLFTTALKQEIE